MASTAAAAGFYPSFFSSGTGLSLEGGSSTVDEVSRGKLTKAVKSLTLTPFANLDSDYDVVTPPFRVATSDGVFHSNSDQEDDHSSSHFFRPCQLMWEIAAHTEKTSDQESSRMLPELVLTDSSFLSTTMIQDDVQKTEKDQNQNTVDLRLNPAIFELLTDESEPISSFQRGSLELSPPHEDSIFSPRIQPRTRTNPQEDLAPQWSAQRTPNHVLDHTMSPNVNQENSRLSDRPFRSKQDDQQSFDRHQMLQKANIQVQLELHKIEASNQQQQSIEDGLSKGETTPRCSIKSTISNTISRLSRAVYHCCHRKQSKKEKELMKKMRENCNRMQQLTPSSSPCGVWNSASSPSSSSYHRRRYALMKQRLEGMINSTSEEQESGPNRPFERDMLKLDLRKVHGSAPGGTAGCLPTSGRRSLSSKYKKQKTGSTSSTKQKTGSSYSAKEKTESRISPKEKTGSRISPKEKTGSRISAKEKTGSRISPKEKTGSRISAKEKTGSRVSANPDPNSLPALSAKTKDSSSSKNRSSV